MTTANSNWKKLAGALNCDDLLVFSTTWSVPALSSCQLYAGNPNVLILKTTCTGQAWPDLTTHCAPSLGDEGERERGGGGGSYIRIRFVPRRIN